MQIKCKAAIQRKNRKAIGIILLVYILLLLMDAGNGHKHTWTLCVFKNLTGYSCPGCGLGRATLSIFHGNWIEAFQYNILSIPLTLAVLASLIWLIIDLFRQTDSFFSFINRKVSFIYLIPFFVLALASWITNIVRGI